MSDDIHALSGAYAVDALDDEERAEFEKHLTTCATCRQEVDSLREAASALSHLVSATPPPSLRESVLADIATVRPLPPIVEHAEQRRRRFRWATTLVAAALVLVVGIVAWRPWQEYSTDLTAVDQVVQADDAEQFDHAMEGGGSVTVYRSAELDQAAIVARDMPAPPDGKVYEVWFADDAGSMQPAGLLPPTADSEIVLEGAASAATAAGITVEPEGGSPAPTSEPIALVPFTEE